MAGMAHITNNPPTSATTLPQWGYKTMLLGAAAIWGLSTCIIKDTVAVFPLPGLWAFGFSSQAFSCSSFSASASHNALTERCSLPAQQSASFSRRHICSTHRAFNSPPASKGTFLTGTYSIMVPFIAWAISKQRPTRYNIAAALLALAGIGFISFSGAGAVSPHLRNRRRNSCSPSAFFRGLHMAVSARLSDGRDALALSAIQFIVAGLIGMAWEKQQRKAHQT